MTEMLTEQNTYRYNGMLIGTFELLEDSRNQVRLVESSIDAAANFLRAQLALDATLIGSPSDLSVAVSTQSQAVKATAGH